MMKRNKHHYKGMICKELVLLGCMVMLPGQASENEIMISI
jgi:hypothetical protein